MSEKPSARTGLQNWRDSDASFAAKIGMTLKNNWIKVKSGKRCCGNHGDPGC